MEIVISMAIDGVLALLATQIMSSMNVLMRATDQLNDRLSYEAKYADNMQTANDSGTPFDMTPITYTVNYGGHLVGDAAREAAQYTMSYPSDRVSGTNYAENVNYRFLTFDKVLTDVSECPDGPFFIQLRLVPYFSDDVPADDADKEVEIEKAKAILEQAGPLQLSIGSPATFSEDDVVTSPTHDDIDLKALGLNGSQATIGLKNISRGVPTSVKQVKVELGFKAKKEALGAQREWIDNQAEVYLYVKTGTLDETATFYNQCIIEFNVNSGQIKAFKSLTQKETPPATVDYEGVLAAIKAAKSPT